MATRRSTSRRWFLGGLGAAGVVVWVGGRGYYAPEEGAAYTPWRPPDDADPLLALVHAATLAANPHNTQPWRFRLSPGQIELYADPGRSLGAMDPLGREQRIGLGCALENLVLAAGHRGLGPVVQVAGAAAAPTLVARISLSPGAADPEPLFPFLAQRRTHRGRYADPPLSPAQLSALAPAAPVEVRWLISDAEKAAFSELVTDATLAILSDQEMSEASFRWFRQTRAEIAEHRDGLTLDAQGLGTLMTVAAKIGPRTGRQTADRFWLASTRDPEQRRASAFGILSTPALEDRDQLLAAGRAYQRMHLLATAQGLDMQPLNQPAERRDRERQLGHAPELGARLAALAGSSRAAQMIFRIGRGIGPAHHSPRRAAAEVLL